MPPFPPVPPGLPEPLDSWAEGLRAEREAERALLAAAGTPRFLGLSAALHGTPDAATVALARGIEAATRDLPKPPPGTASVAEACRAGVALQQASSPGLAGEVADTEGRGCVTDDLVVSVPPALRVTPVLRA